MLNLSMTTGMMGLFLFETTHERIYADPFHQGVVLSPEHFMTNISDSVLCSACYVLLFGRLMMIGGIRFKW